MVEIHRGVEVHCGPPAPAPHASRHLYPVLAGPGACYPAEANVPPVWRGTGSAPFDPAVFAHVPAAEVLQHPAPIITSLDTCESWDESWYPIGPRSLAKAAREAGWEVRVGFSRGYVPGQAKDSWAVRDMIGVWINGYCKRAVATWERNPNAEHSARKLEAGNVKPGEIPTGMAWSTSGTSIMTGDGTSWGYASLTDLKEWLALRGRVLPGWYTMIRDWVLAHAEHAERKAKAKPAKTPTRAHA